MFDEKEYIEVFSKVTASPKIRQEVMNMGNRKTSKFSSFGRRIAVLAAAAILLTAMTVTAFASEEIAGWFHSFFSGRSNEGLSDQQISYLVENEAPLSQGITHDGWTIELISAIQDEVAGYVLFRVTAPVDYPLEPEKDDREGNVIFGNFSRKHFQNARPDLLKASDDVSLGSWGFQWADDGDGKANTRNFVLHLAPSEEASSVDPFGPEAKYYIHIADMVREIVDEKYYKQLMLTKYGGQDAVHFTEEELDTLYKQELLAEGIWEFTVTFHDSENASNESVELLSEPMGMACMFMDFPSGELEERMGRVQIYSIEMRHLSVTFRYGACIGYPELTTAVKITNSDGTGYVPGDGERVYPCVVLKDGREIRLLSYGFGTSECVTLEAEAPIIFEEVSHIRMADGTIIPMPETE